MFHFMLAAVKSSINFRKFIDEFLQLILYKNKKKKIIGKHKRDKLQLRSHEFEKEM